MPGNSADLDRLASLEAERSFLLKSLRDLEAEHEAGDVDEHDYTTLRDGYTKRAADVLRQIDAGKATLPKRRPVRWGRRLAGVGVVAAAAVGIGWVVADSSGQRLPGQEVTGGVVAERDDVGTLLSEARALLTQSLLGDAQERYTRVLDLEPDNVEAKTYLAWLLFIGSGGATDEVRDAAADAATQQLEEAVELAPDYPDAHCFLAVIAENHRGDTATARREADTCLSLDPPGEIEGIVEDFIAGLDSPPASTPGTTEP